MQFHESDIIFSDLDHRQFEELCFDLLVKFQFHHIKWRQGGSDKGRDIEATFTVSNALTGTYDERWFVECKHYQSGLGVVDLSEKIEWAKAENPDHFVVATSSYLTQNTHEWLSLMKNNSPFNIHVLEGKALKHLLLSQPSLILKYFQEETAKLIQQLLKQWIVHDILPEPKAIYDIFKKVNASKLDGQSLAFLWFVCHNHEEDIEKYCWEEDLPKWDYSFLLSFFEGYLTHDYPVFLPNEMKERGLALGYGYSQKTSEANNEKQVHIFQKLNNGKILEIYLRRIKGEFEYRIGIGKNTTSVLQKYEDNFLHR